MKVKTMVLAFAVTCAVPAGLLIACSSNPTNTTQCGAGTSLADGTCVAVDSGRSDAPSLQDSTPGTGDATASADSQVDGGGPPGSDATTAPEAGTDAALASDPCPVSSNSTSVVLDCDPHCGDAGLSACAPAACGQGPITLPLPQQMLPESFVIRTPEAPGIDPACEADCPNSGFVYGLGIEIPGMGSLGGGYQLTVGSPWEIVGLVDPYCDYQNLGDSSAAGAIGYGCWWADAIGGTKLYVVTADPNAPARNITVTFYSNVTPCPDGGP